MWLSCIAIEIPSSRKFSPRCISLLTVDVWYKSSFLSNDFRPPMLPGCCSPPWATPEVNWLVSTSFVWGSDCQNLGDVCELFSPLFDESVVPQQPADPAWQNTPPTAGLGSNLCFYIFSPSFPACSQIRMIVACWVFRQPFFSLTINVNILIHWQ